MFPIELNQGGNYLIIRLCLARPGGERERWGGGEGWKEERGDAGGREGDMKKKKKTQRKGREGATRSSKHFHCDRAGSSSLEIEI